MSLSEARTLCGPRLLLERGNAYFGQQCWIASQEAERGAAIVTVAFAKQKSTVKTGHTPMIRIGYAPGAYDLFHIGHLNLLRRAKEHCEYLIASVVADEVLIRHKGVTPVIPLAERVEIVRNVRFVDAAIPALTNDKVEVWNDLRFNVLFKGNDWQGTEKGNKLKRDFAAVGVEIVYFPYTLSTSSSALRRALQNIDALAGHSSNGAVLERAA
jgi:glycerol-3-phosphate cytidylyltransferase